MELQLSFAFRFSLTLFFGTLTLMVPYVKSQEPIALNYTINEELEPGYEIANIVSAAHLYEFYSDEVMATLEYFFLKEGDPFGGYFAVHETSGVLTVVRRIDRDTLCANSATCVADLDIAIRPRAYFRQIKVRVTVQDVNDNTPRFEQDALLLAVPENSLPGSSFRLPSVWDPDSGVRGIRNFTLQPDTSLFSLRVRDGLRGQRDLDLLVNSRLDRESDSHHRLHVLCFDGGSPRRTGTLTIDVQVSDDNDNPPTFTNLSYTVTVPESVAPGTSLLQVQARDADAGANGRLRYSFGRNTVQLYSSVFIIDERTGEISTISALDADTPLGEDAYVLNVEAVDGGASPLSDYATVTIHVIDENDNAPHLRVNTYSASGQAEAPEHAANGTFVLLWTVSDPDSGENGRVTCEILHTNPQNPPAFAITPTYSDEYHLVTAAVFDREVTSQYDVTIECADHGAPPQVTQLPITVHVTDINDHAPNFTHAQYNVTLMENNPVDRLLITVAATDKDIGMNGQITYGIFAADGEFGSAENENGVVSIDSRTGAVHADVSFDRELREDYRFTVIATDSGVPRRSTSATLSLHILDANDQAPTFNVTRMRFGTFENQPVGTEIGTVHAGDTDLFPNNNVAYSWVTSVGQWSDFNLDSVSGVITTRRQLDRENVAEYHLKVTAGNPGFYELSSTVDVIMFVADRNDNAPHIDFPAQGNSTVNVTAALSVGDTVTRVLAHDVDIGKNSDLTYSIVAGNEYGYFEMNSQTGEVDIAELMEFVDVDVEMYNLHVMVSDRGSPPLYSTAQLRIAVSASALMSQHVTSQNSGNGQRNNLLVIVISCTFLLCVVFIMSFLLALFLMRRRKQPDIRGRNNSSCMEATRALLTMKASSATVIKEVDATEVDNVHPQSAFESGDADEGDAEHRKDMVPWNPNKQYAPVLSQPCDSPTHPYPCKNLASASNGLQGEVRGIDVRIHERPAALPGVATCHMREIQLRVHEMLYEMNNVSQETESNASDSGKGPSEEGDSFTGTSSFPMVVFNPPRTCQSPQPPQVPLRSSQISTLSNSPINAMLPSTLICSATSQSSQALYAQPNKPSILKKYQISALPPVHKPLQAPNIPDYSQTDTQQKKKSVHFVKPYLHSQTPLYDSDNVAKRVPIKPNSITSDYRKKNDYSKKPPIEKKDSNSMRHGEDYSKYAYPDEKEEGPLPYGHPYLVGQLRKGHPLPPLEPPSDDNESFDDHDGSSTSGSYCIDTAHDSFLSDVAKPQQHPQQAQTKVLKMDNCAYPDHVFV